MSHKVLVIQNAEIQQGGQTILRNVNLSIEAGEFVYVVGKTGSGKSSLLKTIYGALPYVSGDIVVNSTPLNSVHRGNIHLLRRKLGIIFQDFNLLMDRSVHQNLAFALKATGWKNKLQIDQKIHESLRQVDLLTSQHKMLHTLSGGEQQRVAIARALLNDAQLIIADEPTGNLDPETSDDIIMLLRALCREKNITVLIATHDYRIIERFTGRVVRCHDGQVFVDQAYKV